MNETSVKSLDRLLVGLKAIADEKRLRILDLLATGERCVCELQDELSAGQSLLSFHLRTLKDAGLVTDRRQGRWVYYALERDALGVLERSLGDMRAAAERDVLSSSCCDDR